MEEFSRTELLIKKEGIESLQNSTVAIFGVGGVGGFVVEALARAGVGTLHIIDHDTVSISNLNRQIIATHQTIDQKKVEVMKERILSINPRCNVQTYDDFFLPETVDYFPFDEFDYIVDAVDTVTAKIKLVEIAQEKKITKEEKMRVTGSQLVAEILLEHGVDTVFGYPGGTILNIYDELYRHPEIHHILTSHEQGAAHAAD